MAEGYRQMEYQGTQPGMQIDLRTIFHDVLSSLWQAFALAAAAGLIAYLFSSWSFKPVYQVTSTYVVTSRGANNNMLNNLNSAKNATSLLQQILVSPSFRESIIKQLGTDQLEGTITCDTIADTNLLRWTVTSSTPYMAFAIMRCAEREYPAYTQVLMDDMIIRNLESGEVPTKPSNDNNPRRLMLIVFGIVFFVLLLTSAIISALRDTVRSGRDAAAKLDTRYLGSIASEKKYKTVRQKLTRKRSALLVDQPLTSFRYTESIHKVCRRLMNRMDKRKAKILMITSCLENEGKSTTVANLALGLAEAGKRVLLIDMDLRKPSLYKIFDFDESPIETLCEVLQGQPPTAPLVERMQGNLELYYIFNTRSSAKSTEMLTNGRMEKLLEMLRPHFDYILLDTPPMGNVADSEAVASLAEASLIVVREHTSSAKHINDVIDELSMCKAVPIGCILNDAHESLGGHLHGGYAYSYGRGYGSGYGSRYKYGYGSRNGYGKGKKKSSTGK